MLLPLKDENPITRIAFQYVTVTLIAACTAVFLWQLSLGAEGGREMVMRLGAIPSVLFGNRELPPGMALVPAPVTLLTSMFMHGGWMHLIGNMLFLWVLGDNVEDSMGHVRFVVFYLLCGIAAALAHAATDPASTTPMIGASGAISGIIGAYLVLHPKVRILTLALRFFIHLPAFVVLGLWIGLQLINAAGDDGAGGGVAWWAHIGGFAAGALLIAPFRDKSVPLFNGLLSPGVTGDNKQAVPRAMHFSDPWGRIGREEAAKLKAKRTRRSSIPDSGRARKD